MASMKSTPRLRLEPRPSHIACGAIVVLCVSSAVVIAVMRGSLAVTAVSSAVVFVVLVSALWRCRGRGVPALLHVGIDRRITVTDRNGRSESGAILDDSYVGSVLTTIVWQADGDPWWRVARSVLILPDTLPPDEFRRLRVVLRYGRAPTEAVTSGVDAG
jgi:membrane-bound toxin of toxin-antitoxin system